MFDLRRSRTRKLSVRSIIAVVGVVAATFGLAQATGTIASPTDAVTTTGSQVASGNFYPTPPVKGLYCHVKFVGSQNQAHVDWTKPDGPGPYQYKWEIYRNNKTTLVNSGVTSDLWRENRANSLPDNDWYYLRVKTINAGNPSAESSGWQGVEIKRISGIQASCGGGVRWDQNNAAWENTTNWDPSTPAPVGNPLARGGGDSQAQQMAPQVDVTEETKADETTTSETPTSTTEAPTTTTEAPTSTSPTSTTTTPPATTAPETTPTTTESATAPTTAQTTGSTPTTTTTTTASRLAAGQIDLGDGLSAKLVDDKVVVLDDGAEQCSASVAGAAKIADRGDGKLAVTDSDGKVHYVDTANCAIS